MSYRLSGYGLLCAALLLVVAGCDRQTDATVAPVARTPEPHLVVVETIGRTAVNILHERSGSLRARRQVRIHNQEEGRIDLIPFYEGDRVKAGDTLILLDDELLRAQLEKASATSRLARINLDRLQGLVKKRAASDDERLRAQTALEIALAEQKLLEARVEHTRIKAPLDGVISERRAEPGDVASSYSHLLTLVDPDSLMTEIHVSELLLPQIKLGDPVGVRIDALGGERFAGRIQRIHPALDPVSRQGVVEVTVDPVPEGARPGQFARVTLESALAERILVPFMAVKRDRDGEFIYLLSDQGSSVRHPVKTGIRTADRIEIIEGVEPGEQIIVRGFLGLTDGKQVKPVAIEGPSGTPAR